MLRTLFIDRAAAAVWKQRFTDCLGRAVMEKEKGKKKKEWTDEGWRLELFNEVKLCQSISQKRLVGMNRVRPQPQTKGFTSVFRERGGALRPHGDGRARRVGMSALYALRRWILNTPWHRHVCVCVYTESSCFPLATSLFSFVSPLAVKHVQTLLPWSSTSSKRKIHSCQKLALNNLLLYRHSNFTVASRLLTYAHSSPQWTAKHTFSWMN